MSRVQLALNVTDVDAAVDFYRRLLGVEPAKREAGYANFAVSEPPLKLVLFESADAARGGTINHLGIEVETADAVEEASRRLSDEGLSTDEERDTVCCFARQDKVWVTDPDGAKWEVYTVLEDVTAEAAASAAACCS